MNTIQQVLAGSRSDLYDKDGYCIKSVEKIGLKYSGQAYQVRATVGEFAELIAQLRNAAMMAPTKEAAELLVKFSSRLLENVAMNIEIETKAKLYDYETLRQAASFVLGYKVQGDIPRFYEEPQRCIYWGLYGNHSEDLDDQQLGRLKKPGVRTILRDYLNT